ncbi:MAG TPA: four helix bundle protein [Pyrinomonadaceae bacterium]|nr:four helix bundle protein [Pyrinomonadaceae bacterium]
MGESILSSKSYAFALRVVKLYRFMIDEHREFVLSKQILRSGTSIGANIEESVHAQSKIDFIHKLSIGQKEAIETNYWLRLLKDSGYIEEKLAESFLADCEEIQRLLAASIKTAKSNLGKAATERL